MLKCDFVLIHQNYQKMKEHMSDISTENWDLFMTSEEILDFLIEVVK